MIRKTLYEFQTSKNSKIKKLKILYKLILNYGPIRAETLAEKANIKPATCARLLDELTKIQLISAEDFGESTGGRKPILYTINSSNGYLIGIEMSTIYSTILLLNMELSVLDTVKLKIEQTESLDEIIENVLPKVNILLDKHNLNIDDVLGVGISIDDLLESITSERSNKSDLNIQLRAIEKYISKKISTYVTLGSGINFAALAEYRLRYSSHSQRFVFTSCDTEIRSCAIMHGYHSFTQPDIANAFGHTTIDINGPVCSCGSFGCLNSYSSLPAIKNKIIQQIRRGKPSLIQKLITSESDINYHIIFQALEANDPICIEVIEEAAYYYGIAIANMILTQQPDTVVCGGTLVPKSTFFAMVKRTIKNKLRIYPQLKTKIYPANDSYEIVAQGAGGIVLEKLLEE